MNQLDLPGCRTPWRLMIRRRLAAARDALRHRRISMTLPPGWDDDDRLAGAGVPRRPRPPAPKGAVALELPESDGC